MSGLDPQSNALQCCCEYFLPGSTIRNLYLHIPFCVSRCRYCAFESNALPHNDPVLDGYCDALVSVLRKLSNASCCDALDTLYFGGGTPSYLGLRRLSNLMYLISLKFNIQADAEISIEANPDSFDRRLFKDLWALGVNRFSLGVQSFDDGLLRTLGRPHDAAQALQAIEILKDRDANFSIDLICGIPGQSMDSWISSIEQAVALDIPHISVYPLSIEEGTAFAEDVACARMDAPDEDLQADMLLLARDMLEAAGLKHYEIASYARPGFESRHNLCYWQGRQYLGLGSSAASLLRRDSLNDLVDVGLIRIEQKDASALLTAGAYDGFRLRCSESASRFSVRPAACPMEVELEHLDLRSLLIEQFMLRMRLFTAMDPAAIADACCAIEGLDDCLSEMKRCGYLSKDCVPTDKGWLLGNHLYAAIWDLA